jgi:hypothetical protein
MKLLTGVLLSLSLSAWAEWTQVSETGRYIGYADMATIRKKGNRVKIWLLFDYSSSQSNNHSKYLSERVSGSTTATKSK